jgi:phosphoribosyl 1,2-cyclic phosphodiesterase
MKVQYWGVRGSIPVPGSSTVRVGGNTPCVSIEMDDGGLLIIDGGTGIRNLGRHLMTQADFASGTGTATLLISHRHWDHIHGIPFFEPAYIAGNIFDIYSPAITSSGDPLADNMVTLSYSPTNFPVPYSQMKAAYRFHITEENAVFRIGSAKIHPVRLNHPGTTLGYVITEDNGVESGGAKVAYICDTGPWDGPVLGDRPADEPRLDHGQNTERREQLVSAMQGADLVIHDTFFEEAGYEGRAHWGHSAPSHGLSLCHHAQARRLHLFHFAPDLDDDAVFQMGARTRARAAPIEVAVATEGMEITLP